MTGRIVRNQALMTLHQPSFLGFPQQQAYHVWVVFSSVQLSKNRQTNIQKICQNDLQIYLNISKIDQDIQNTTRRRLVFGISWYILDIFEYM